MKDISRNLKRLRQKSGLTQEALAERLHVTRQAVSNWETGKNLPDLELLTALAGALEADAGELLYGPPGREERRRQMVTAGVLWALAAAVFALRLALTGPARELMMKTFRPGLAILAVFVLGPLLWLLLGAAVPALVSLWRDPRPKGRRLRRAMAWTGAALTALYVLWAAGVWLWSWHTAPLAVGLVERRPQVFLLPGALLFCGLSRKSG